MRRLHFRTGPPGLGTEETWQTRILLAHQRLVAAGRVRWERGMGGASRKGGSTGGGARVSGGMGGDKEVSRAGAGCGGRVGEGVVRQAAGVATWRRPGGGEGEGRGMERGRHVSRE